MRRWKVHIWSPGSVLILPEIALKKSLGGLEDVWTTSSKKVVSASISYQSKRSKSRRFIDVFGVCFCRLDDKTLSLQEPEGKI